MTHLNDQLKKTMPFEMYDSHLSITDKNNVLLIILKVKVRWKVVETDSYYLDDNLVWEIDQKKSYSGGERWKTRQAETRHKQTNVPLRYLSPWNNSCRLRPSNDTHAVFRLSGDTEICKNLQLTLNTNGNCLISKTWMNKIHCKYFAMKVVSHFNQGTSK